MALTPRFGLTQFSHENGASGSAEGSLSDDGGKYTGRDRRVIDRILAAFEVHNHVGGNRLGDPEGEPELELLTDEDGELPSGETYFYRVSYVDRYGLETAAGSEVSVETPGAVGIPETPRVEAKSGGTLEEGLHWYALSVAKDGNETHLSVPALVHLTDWLTVEVSAPNGLPEGVDEVSVWRQGPFDSDFVRIYTESVTTPEDPIVPIYSDDGSEEGDPTQPPDENLTNATNAVRITIPEEDVASGTLVRRWRIYRSTESGEFPSNSLVAEVSETETEDGDDLVHEYLDTGATEPSMGNPLEVSQTLTPSRPLGGDGSTSPGTQGAGGPLLMTDGDGDIWRVLATVPGQLETRSTGLSTDVDLAFFLTDEADSTWHVSVGTDGVLETDNRSPTVDDRIFAQGDGPMVPTGDPTVTWRLNVTTDGVLVTGGEPVPGVDLAYMRPVEVEPAAPEVGGVFYMLGGELHFKKADGSVTQLT